MASEGRGYTLYILQTMLSEFTVDANYCLVFLVQGFF